jgi:sec-independent protein translocase protein TatC
MERETIVELLKAAKRFLLKSLVVFVVAGACSFFYSRELLLVLLRTVNIKVYYYALSEAFLASVELALYAGLFFSIPFVFLLLWHEFRHYLKLKPLHGYLFALCSIILFYVGSIFCYAVVLRSGISFLLGYEGGHLKAMISVERFVRFTSAMIFAFGLTFEVPVILLAFNRAGLVKSQALTKTRRFAILFITIASALITPTPDVYNMMLLAVPTYILYEIGIFLMKVGEKRDARTRASASDQS